MLGILFTSSLGTATGNPNFNPLSPIVCRGAKPSDLLTTQSPPPNYSSMFRILLTAQFHGISVFLQLYPNTLL